MNVRLLSLRNSSFPSESGTVLSSNARLLELFMNLGYFDVPKCIPSARLPYYYQCPNLPKCEIGTLQTGKLDCFLCNRLNEQLCH